MEDKALKMNHKYSISELKKTQPWLRVILEVDHTVEQESKDHQLQ